MALAFNIVCFSRDQLLKKANLKHLFIHVELLRSKKMPTLPR